MKTNVTRKQFEAMFMSGGNQVVLFVSNEQTVPLKQYYGSKTVLEEVEADFGADSWMVNAIKQFTGQQVVPSGSTIVPEKFFCLGLMFDPLTGDVTADYTDFIETAFAESEAYGLVSQYNDVEMNEWFALYGTAQKKAFISEKKVSTPDTEIIAETEKSDRIWCYNNLLNADGMVAASLAAKSIALNPAARLTGRTLNGITPSQKTYNNPTGILTISDIEALKALNIGEYVQNTNKTFVTNLSKTLSGEYFDYTVMLDEVESAICKTMDMLESDSINLPVDDRGRAMVKAAMANILEYYAQPKNGVMGIIVNDIAKGPLYRIEIPTFAEANPTSVQNRIIDEINVFFTIKTETEQLDITLHCSAQDITSLGL